MRYFSRLYDYLFYCTYHFLSKVRKTSDREDDVTWAFSLLWIIVLFALTMQVIRFLYFENLISWRPTIPFFFGLAVGLTAICMYLNHLIFIHKDRYKQILTFYGKDPSRKDIVIGLI